MVNDSFTYEIVRRQLFFCRDKSSLLGKREPKGREGKNLRQPSDLEPGWRKFK